MTHPDRTASGRRGGRRWSQVVTGALALLAVAGSIALVFANDPDLLRLGLVAALWVSVLSLIAVTKYRKELQTSATRSQDLRLVYELELEREVRARREHELAVEREVRERVSHEVRVETRLDLAELRGELTGLRESLARLLSGDLLVERVALRAEAIRLHSAQDASRWDRGPSAQITPSPRDPLEAESAVEAEFEAEPAVEAEPEVDGGSPDPESHPGVVADPGSHSAGRSVSDLLAAYGASENASHHRRRAGD